MVFLNALFLLSALLILGCVVLLMMTKNIIHSCIYLLGTLIGIAGLYVTMGADFVAAVQVLVYVGGVVILILFAVMLTGGQDFLKAGRLGRHLTPAMGNKKSFAVGALAGVVLLLSLYKIISGIGFGAGHETTVLTFESTVEKLGTLLVTDHVLAFEMVSILLLGALIGAAVIARPIKPKKLDN